MATDDHRREAPPEDDRPALPEGNAGLLAEFWDFILHNKAWWMTPIVVLLVLMVAFILWAEASPVLPFVYTIM